MNRIAKRFAIGSVALLVALLAGLPVAETATSPAAPAGGEVSLQPLHPSTATPSYFTFNEGAGTTITDALVIKNHTAASVSLIVSPVDGLTGQTSGAVYANRQDKVFKAGLWVTPSVSALTLAGNTSRTVSFTVTIPKTATAGDHLAGIAVENTVPVQSSNGFAIKQILRNVIGVRVIVPGKATFIPKLSSLGIEQIGATGIGSVTVGLANSGLQLAKPTLTVALNGPSGYARTLKRNLDTILPGDTITYPFAWPGHPAQGFLRRHRNAYGRRPKRDHEPHCRTRRHSCGRHPAASQDDRQDHQKRRADVDAGGSRARRAHPLWLCDRRGCAPRP